MHAYAGRNRNLCVRVSSDHCVHVRIPKNNLAGRGYLHPVKEGQHQHQQRERAHEQGAKLHGRHAVNKYNIISVLVLHGSEVSIQNINIISKWNQKYKPSLKP